MAPQRRRCRAAARWVPPGNRPHRIFALRRILQVAAHCLASQASARQCPLTNLLASGEYDHHGASAHEPTDDILTCRTGGPSARAFTSMILPLASSRPTNALTVLMIWLRRSSLSALSVRALFARRCREPPWRRQSACPCHRAAARLSPKHRSNDHPGHAHRFETDWIISPR